MRWAVVALACAMGCATAPPPRPVIGNRDRTDAPAAGRFHGAITEAGLRSLMETRFARQLAAGTFVADFNGTLPDLLTELEAMGIHDLGQLARLIPSDYDRRAAADFQPGSPANIPGVLRDVFIIHDARRYFRDAWHSHWQSLSDSNLPLYRHYGVDLDVLVEAGVISQGALTGALASPPPPRPRPPSPVSGTPASPW